MQKFRKKPVVVEAATFDEFIQYGLKTGVPLTKGMPWSFDYVTSVTDKAGEVHEHIWSVTHENDDCYLIPTLEGTMKFSRGEMLITGVKGEIYPCKMDIFMTTYDPLQS